MPAENPPEDTAHDDVELVVVKQTKTTFGAENIAGILEASGIPTLVEGRSLQDEFALSQRALGLTGCRVKVRKRDLENARRIIEEAQATSEALDSEEREETDS